uniref:Uncharacterized protein n=1 Tax=Rhizophora mucronata TaxID=61149 RepID=A0A2P2JEL4_RHIMU
MKNCNCSKSLCKLQSFIIISILNKSVKTKQKEEEMSTEYNKHTSEHLIYNPTWHS